MKLHEWTVTLSEDQLGNSYLRAGFDHIITASFGADGDVIVLNVAHYFHVLRRSANGYQVRHKYLDAVGKSRRVGPYPNERPLLLTSSAPLVGSVKGATLEATLAVEHLDAGITFTVPVVFEGDTPHKPSMGHWQHEGWLTAAQAPKRGLLRVSGPSFCWYRPGVVRAAWCKTHSDRQTSSAYAVSPDGSMIVFMLDAEKRSKLVAYATDTGSTMWTRPLGDGARPVIRFSSDGSSFVAFTDDKARCNVGCKRAYIVDTKTGSVRRSFPLNNTIGDRLVRPVGYSYMQVGYAGDLLWFYRLREADDGGGHRFKGRPARCNYEVYDANVGKRIRTHLDATGAWLKRFQGCAIRAMSPIRGGGVIAIRITSPSQLTVLQFDAAP